ncbi:hypothetical protein SAMN04487981_12966 [Streptomyces sp. cf386]|nr:hypothetical protein SAMN04487981_12966 [Streptomyces sp. cf386]
MSSAPPRVPATPATAMIAELRSTDVPRELLRPRARRTWPRPSSLPLLGAPGFGALLVVGGAAVGRGGGKDSTPLPTKDAIREGDPPGQHALLTGLMRLPVRAGAAGSQPTDSCTGSVNGRPGQGVGMGQGWESFITGAVGLTGAIVGGVAAIIGARIGAEKTAQATRQQVRDQARAEHQHWLRQLRLDACEALTREADEWIREEGLFWGHIERGELEEAEQLSQQQMGMRCLAVAGLVSRVCTLGPLELAEAAQCLHAPMLALLDHLAENPHIFDPAGGEEQRGVFLDTRPEAHGEAREAFISAAHIVIAAQSEEL